MTTHRGPGQQNSSQLDEQKQMDLVRDRFTRTAGVFADFALAERGAEAEHLLRLIDPAGSERALDVACGPGTLARIFARQVRWIGGLDLTPAMLARARDDASANHIGNFSAARGNALQMPFHEETFDIVITSYSIHHLPDPFAAVREIARVLKRGGKFGLLDMVVSENTVHAKACNDIEIARDASHTRALPVSEFKSLLTSCGFAVAACEIEDHPRSFDQWMHTAGWKRGDEAFEQTRRLLEASISGDTAGLHAKFLLGSPTHPSAAGDSRPDIELHHTAAFIVGRRQ
ncbi:MAG TPA: methyltransferase domain-containing protein [Candidatus Acidoferrales bacterium]|nr:methyltransferase domain-containing protein [Candidatus Acidoferrales bacterium]